MNRWLLIRRLRGPAFLLLFGITALLHEWHILSFSQSWPLYLVLAGVLSLAERAAFQQPDPSQMPPTPYPGYYAGANPGQQPPAGWAPAPPAAPATPGTSLATTPPSELDRPEGGR